MTAIRKGLSHQQFERAKTVAFVNNAHLPEAYQVELFEESLRVAESVLAPRGLEERLVLIVGGAGYIGSVLTEQLLRQGYRVRSQDLLLYHNQLTVLPFLGRPGYEFVQGDYADRDHMEACLEGVTDVVILAGLVGDPITKKYPNESQRINHDGMLALIDRLDGLTVDHGDWWFNLRPSNTEPLLRLNVEAKTDEACKTHVAEVLDLVATLIANEG